MTSVRRQSFAIDSEAAWGAAWEEEKEDGMTRIEEEEVASWSFKDFPWTEVIPWSPSTL